MGAVQIGILGSAFYLGLIPSQLIGGLLGYKFGPKAISVTGLLGVALASLAMSVSNSFEQFVVLRFLTGFFAPYFSSPALALLSASGQRNRSLGVGIYNSMFNVGAALTLMSFVFLDQDFGWRLSFIVTGGLNLVAMAWLAMGRYRTQSFQLSEEPHKGLLDLIRNRYIFGLSISALVASIAESILGQFLVFYLESFLHYLPAEAGALNSLYWIIGIFGGFVIGYYYQTARNRRIPYVAAASSLALLIVAIPYAHSIFIMAAILSSLGFLVNAVLSILYFLILSSAGNASESSLYLGYNNFLQKTVSSAFPFLFMEFGKLAGLSASWILIGVSGLALLILGMVPLNAIRQIPKASD